MFAVLTKEMYFTHRKKKKHRENRKTLPCTLHIDCQMCQIALSKSAQKKKLGGDSSDSSDSNDSGDSSDQTTFYTKTSHWLSNVSNHSSQKYCILTVVTAVTVVTVVRKNVQALKKISFFSEHFLKEQSGTFDNRWDVLRAAFCDSCDVC